MLKEILRTFAPADRISPQRPDLPSSGDDLQPSIQDKADELSEYARLCKAIGFHNPHVSADLEIERFKSFLRGKDWPVFSLPTVTEYMDKKSAAEGNGYGWQWRPLREKDQIRDAKFGNPARNYGNGHGSKAQDYYLGPNAAKQEDRMVSIGFGRDAGLGPEPYNKLVPLHALRKVSAIESEFRGSVSFMVCDYTTAPHIVDPDPFLMAVINNSRLHEGVGRFVIDFWDEPGFGLEQQVAT